MPLAMNQKSNRKYKERGWICLGCKGTPSTGVSDGVDGGGGAEEVQEGEGDEDEEGEGAGVRESHQHILICPTYADLRIGKHLLEDDVQLITYYKQVLERRATFADEEA